MSLRHEAKYLSFFNFTGTEAIDYVKLKMERIKLFMKISLMNRLVLPLLYLR
jgi:hypothetical protein